MNFKKAFALLLAALTVMLSACTSTQSEAPGTEAAMVSEAISTSKTTEAAEDKTEKSTERVTQGSTTAPTETTSKPKETTTKSTTATVTKATTTTKQTTAKPTSVVTAPTSAHTTKPTTTTTTTTTQATTAVEYCTLTIDCKAILENIDDLKAGHKDYVPSSGYILQGYKVEYAEGDTAYDILKKGSKDNGIRLNTQSTMFGTYVAGINGLDERDCGAQSGWLYTVNSTSPSVSCSKYEVKPNDTVCFKYTCSY